MSDGTTSFAVSGPISTRKALTKADLTLDDIDLFEINEAFAVMAEKFIRDLKLA